MYNALDLYDEYNLQNEFIKIRKLFVDIFTFELFFIEDIKLKNHYLEILKNKNSSKSLYESRKIKKIYKKHLKKYCVNKKENFYELNKNICFVEKEILNRFFFNITIKNSNYKIKHKFAYIYKLFRSFCFLLCKKGGSFYKKKDNFLDTLYIKKFCILLNYLIKGNKKNVYFQLIKKQLQKCATIKERKEEKKKNGKHSYLYITINNTYKNYKNNSKQYKVNNVNIGHHFYKINSFNYCIDRRRNNYGNSNFSYAYKYNKLKVDLEKLKYFIEKVVYNDFYFNILNCIFYSLINKNIYSLSDSIYLLYHCGNIQNSQEIRAYYDSKCTSQSAKCLNNFFIFIKILFSSYNMYRKYTEGKLLMFDEFFLFENIKIFLKESIKRLLFITIVNSNKLYAQLSFKYIFNLFLFYFIFLDINFCCPIFFIKGENTLKTEKIYLSKYLIKNKDNKNCSKSYYENCEYKYNYEKKNDNSNDINQNCDHVNSSSNNYSNVDNDNNNYDSNNNNTHNNTHNNNNDNNNFIKKKKKKVHYTICFFCSFSKLKKENISVIEKKKIFTFFILYILHYNYVDTIEYDDSFLSYSFYIYVKNFFDFKEFHMPSLRFSKKVTKEKNYDHCAYCYHAIKRKIGNNFTNFFKKLNKKNIYIEYFYSLINAKELSLYNLQKKKKYKVLEISKTNLRNSKTSNDNSIKQKYNVPYLLSEVNRNAILYSKMKNATCKNNKNISNYLFFMNEKNKKVGSSNKVNKIIYENNGNKEYYLENNFYDLECKNKTKNIRIENQNIYNNNLYDYINEKIKIFFENLKILLLPLLKKIYNKSIVYVNIYIYLLMIHSFFLLEKMKKDNVLKKKKKDILIKKKEIDLCKNNSGLCKQNMYLYREKKKIFLRINAIVDKLVIYKYYDFLNILCNNKKNIILKKIKYKKIYFYLKRNLKNFNQWHISLVYKLENLIDVYKYKYMENFEKYFFLLKNNELNNKKYKDIFAISYISYLKRGKNTSLENRINMLLAKRKKYFIKINKNNCLEKYMNILYKKINVFDNIYVNMNSDNFYVQNKKGYIIFRLKNIIGRQNAENIYYEFNRKKYYVFENLYIPKKIYKINYINLCLLFYRYCFFFYNYNPLIFSFLFNNIYCICINCLNKYLVIKCSKKNKITKENHNCFYKQNGILIKNRSNIFIKNFYYLAFFLIIRYQTLIGNVNHSGSQNCIPKRVMDILRKKLEIERECFSSPFNAVLKNYCSIFSDIDIFFGSSGNFFGFNLQNGCYEINPPFDIFLINKLIIYILYNLKKEIHELTFFLIIPYIKDKNYFYELLFSSPYMSYYFFMKANSYTFSTRLFEEREKEYVSTCDCFVFILQNEKAKVRKKIHKNIILKIKRLWENLDYI